ncbi:Pycsar system effector family protein [Cellulomonas biazotea]|uniref:Pycsar effector protein domain-containing protein n=1 Tax=Cellulomonas biazotea TaxID=1709 RepID=A0A402DTZ0_9CELL|nr:Pycsar system effector family protein [Cellulomonas biazotea]GCE77577.1 hypothetical protein CBZ_26330 [Cellulomonas biazotea]
MLAEARAEVGVADFKASMVLAALGIGFTAVLAGLIADDWSPSDLRVPGRIVWWVGAAAAMTSIGCAAAAVWPRYVKADVSGGIHYWGHVATFRRLEDLAAALDGVPRSERGRARTRHQLWRLSLIVSRKYTLLRWAILLASGSIGLFLLAVALGQHPTKG